MESLEMYSSSRCKNRTHVSQYSAVNGNLRKSGSTFCHGTVFAPKQCLYQKKATGMESPKMYSSSWCKIRTYLCWTANDPVSYKPAQGRERKFADIRVLCLHQSNVYIKRNLHVWRLYKCIPLVGAKTSLTCAGLQTTPSHVRQYRAENGNLRKSGTSFSYGTVFLH